MALSREERIRRARATISGNTRPSTQPRPAQTSQTQPRPSQNYQPNTVPAGQPTREPTLAERQNNAWGTRAFGALKRIEHRPAFIGGAAAIGGTALLNRRIQRSATGGRPYGVTGKTSGIEYAGRSRGVAGAIPTYEALSDARNERMPRSVRRVTVGPRRAIRNIDFGGIARNATQNVTSLLTPSPKPNFVPSPKSRYRTGPYFKPIPAGPQAANVRPSTPRPPKPIPAGPQATNVRRPTAGPQATNVRPTPVTSPVDRVGTAQRASAQIRGGARPAVFGNVSESPMNKPGTLNIPRSGKRLTAIVDRAPMIPTLADVGESAPKQSPRKVAKPKGGVEMPKPPKVTSVPSPAPEAKPVVKAEAKPTLSRVTYEPVPKPTATYRPLPSPERVPEVKLTPQPAPSRPDRGGNKKGPKPEKIVFEYEGRSKGTVVHKGGRSYEIRYGNQRFPIPWSPTAESAFEPRSPSRKERPKPSKTWRKSAPGEAQWKSVFAELESRGGQPTSLSNSESARARALGLSESSVLAEKQRAWRAVDPVSRNISKGMGSSAPGAGAKAGASGRGIPSKSGRYAVKIAKIAGLMSPVGVAAAIIDPLASAETASAAMLPSVKKKAQRDFLRDVRSMQRANEVTGRVFGKYYGGKFN